jgi:hypothetical protein
MRSFEPRPIRFLRQRAERGWQIKMYAVRFGPEPFDEARFAPGIAAALGILPQPAVTEARAGVGFCILHRGRGADYVVLAWWDRENELPLRLQVRHADEASWRPARDSESICVWDLQVIAFERDAYVATILATPPRDPSEYLARTFAAGSPPSA